MEALKLLVMLDRHSLRQCCAVKLWAPCLATERLDHYPGPRVSAKSGLHQEGGLHPPLADKADSLPVLLWGTLVELHRTDGSQSPRGPCELAAATERNCDPCAPAAPAERKLISHLSDSDGCEIQLLKFAKVLIRPAGMLYRRSSRVVG